MRLSIIALLWSLTCFTVSAQIVLEQTYNEAGFAGSGNSWQQLYVVRLEVDGDKFVFADKANKELKLYNLDHTLWKIIDFSTATDLSTQFNSQNILYISQHLFDLDDEVEFLYIDNSSTAEISFVTQVINEDGTIIFTADQQSPRMNPTAPQTQLPIYNTTAGAKMILSGAGSANDGNAYVYGLLGSLTTGIVIGPDGVNKQFGASLAYPNPTTNFTRIDYTLPQGVNDGAIVFYDMQGNEVKRYKVDRMFDSLEVSTEHLAAGTYYYNLQTSLGNSFAKKLITIR